MHANLEPRASRCEGSCIIAPIHTVNSDEAEVALQLRDAEAMPIPALPGPPAEVGCIAAHGIMGDPWHLPHPDCPLGLHSTLPYPQVEDLRRYLERCAVVPSPSDAGTPRDVLQEIVHRTGQAMTSCMQALNLGGLKLQHLTDAAQTR